MRSVHHGKAGANAKLRGKLTRLLQCGCCLMKNWKWSERLKEAASEIRTEPERSKEK